METGKWIVCEAVYAATVERAIRSKARDVGGFGGVHMHAGVEGFRCRPCAVLTSIRGPNNEVRFGDELRLEVKRL